MKKSFSYYLLVPSIVWTLFMVLGLIGTITQYGTLEDPGSFWRALPGIFASISLGVLAIYLSLRARGRLKAKGSAPKPRVESKMKSPVVPESDVTHPAVQDFNFNFSNKPIEFDTANSANVLLDYREFNGASLSELLQFQNGSIPKTQIKAIEGDAGARDNPLVLGTNAIFDEWEVHCVDVLDVSDFLAISRDYEALDQGLVYYFISADMKYLNKRESSYLTQWHVVAIDENGETYDSDESLGGALSYSKIWTIDGKDYLFGGDKIRTVGWVLPLPINFRGTFMIVSSILSGEVHYSLPEHLQVLSTDKLFKASGGFAVVDLETNGFGHWATVLEYAVILLDKNFEVESVHSSLVKTSERIDNSHIHGIDMEQLYGAPSWEDSQIHILKLLEGRKLVAHNVPFDKRHLLDFDDEYDNYSEMHISDDIDTMNVGYELTGSKKLTTITEKLGLIHDSHTALGDTMAVVEILKVAANANSETLKTSIARAESWPKCPYEVEEFKESRRLSIENLSLSRGKWLTEVSWHKSNEESPDSVLQYSQLINGFCLNFDLSSEEKILAKEAIEKLRLSRQSTLAVHAEVLKVLMSVEFPEKMLERRKMLLTTLAHNLGYTVSDSTFDGNGTETILGKSNRIFLAGGFGINETQAQRKTKLKRYGFAVADSLKEADILLVRYKDNSTKAAKDAAARGIPVLDNIAFSIYTGVEW